MDPKRALPGQYHRGQTTLPLHLEDTAEPDKLSAEDYFFQKQRASKPATLSRKKPRSAPSAGTDTPRLRWEEVQLSPLLQVFCQSPTASWN